MQSTNNEKLRVPATAKYLAVSASTLAKWRVYGLGPVYSKAGPRIVVYDKQDLDAWLNSNKRTSTSQNDN